jgi:sn-glycerol 3-phosphate transport system substrate-binding protein
MNTFHLSRITSSIVHLACGVWLIACTSSVPEPRPLALTPQPPITLTLWHAYTDTSAALIQTFINDFQAAHPALSVRVERKASEAEILRQGLAALALNQPPDVVLAELRTLAEFARRGALVPLEPLMNDPALGLREDERADFVAGLLETGRLPELGQRTFAFPFEQRPIVLYYNVEALHAAKVAAPRTWEQFSEAARVTTRGQRYGWVMSPNALVWYAMLFSRGGNVLNAAQTHAQFTEAAGVKSLQLIVALTQSGAAHLVASDEQARAAFTQGKATFWFSRTDAAVHLSQAAPTLPWGVTNVPQNDPQRAVTAYDGTAIGIFQRTDAHTRAAWLLTRWLTAPEQSARWSRATLSAPARRSAYALVAPDVPPTLSVWRESDATVPALRAAPTVKDAAQIDATITTLWTNVANGADLTIELKNAAARVNRLLGNVP